MKKHRYIYILPIIGIILSILIFSELSLDAWMDSSNDTLGGIGTIIFMLSHVPIVIILSILMGYMLDKLRFINSNINMTALIFSFIYLLFILFITYSLGSNFVTRNSWIILTLPSSLFMYFDTFFEFGFYRSFFLYILPFNSVFVYFLISITTQKKSKT